MTKHWMVLVAASLAALLALIAPAPRARADIFQWEYINPADPSQGKQQSTMLTTDGAGVTAAPAANLSNRNLTMAYLIGADLGPYSYYDEDGNEHYFPANLTGANLSQADLTNARLDDATLTGANLTGAEVRGAGFHYNYYYNPGAGITLAQLYSTASYQAHDLTGIGLGYSDLTGGNFSVQNLTYANFSNATLTNANFSQANLTITSFQGATLTNANFSQTNLTNVLFYLANLTGANLTGAQVRGANFGNFQGTGITIAQLYSTASYQAHDLTGIYLYGNNLAGGNFAGQNLTSAGLFSATLTNANFSQANLTNARFDGAALTGANFTGAEVRGANFRRATYIGEGGITVAQLYSTASYQAHDLTGIGLAGNNFAGANFADQNLTNADFSAGHYSANIWTGANLTGANLSQANLTNANFSGFDSCDEDGCYDAPGANLTGANLSGADARGANFQYATLTGANTTNLIQSDGHMAGLNLTAGASLVVRDYDGNPAAAPPTGLLPIVVEQHLAMDATGALRMVFDADPWDSTISFAPGITVARAGTLELSFAPDVNLTSQIGRTIDLFDWTGVTPTGAFTVSSPYTWNLSNLYTTGEVTLAAVPGMPGDFNNNGTVDAADYVVWRKNNGTQTAYNTWRANFGTMFGAGSSAALPSAEPLSAAVPEPATLALLAVGLPLLVWRKSRRRRT